MNEQVILEIGREAAWVMLITSGPLLIISMALGLAVSLLQALTTIQEATLTFVPKLAAMLLALVLFLPFMLNTLIEFTQTMFGRIATGG